MAQANIPFVAPYKRGDDFDRWVRGLDYYFVANKITNADQKKATLLHILGMEIQDVFETLKPVESDVPLDGYKEACQRLRRYYQPKTNKVFERFQFHEMTQGADESMEQFIAKLQVQAAKCGFSQAEVESHICDRAVSGCRDMELKQKLLSKAELALTVDIVIHTASSFELCRAQARAMSGAQLRSDSNVNFVRGQPAVAQPRGLKPQHQGRRQQSGGGAARPKAGCYRCGKPGHFARDCYLKDTTHLKCHKCGKTGHLEKRCHTKMVNQVEGVRDQMQGMTGVSHTYEMYHVSDRNVTSKPVLVDVMIDDVCVPMQVDTGATCSVMSRATFESMFGSGGVKVGKSRPNLCAYGGIPLTVVGQVDVKVGYQTQEQVLPLVIVEGDQGCPTLMGRDWLTKIRLNWQELFSVSERSLDTVLEQHKGVFNQQPEGCKKEVSLVVDPAVPPKFYPARPVPLALRAMVDEELDRQVEAGVLVPVPTAQWAAPTVTVLKSDQKSVRICGSYDLTVNKAICLEQYPLPRVDELLTKLSGGKSFSVVDLKAAYLQVPIDEESQKYTAINTHRGLYAAKRLVYGISSAPALFQRLMESTLAGIPHVAVFLDDICVTGSTEEEHLQNLGEVLKRLEDVGLQVNQQKCTWMAPSVTYLGYKVGSAGIEPTADKTKAVREAPEPKDVTQLKSYLGLLLYYNRFLDGVATVAAPLYALLKKGVPWVWGEAQTAAFQQTKELLCRAPCLAHYDVTKPCVVSADASPYGVGAVLSQVDEQGMERPVYFASRALSSAERNYSQIDREGLAVVFAATKFHNFIYGRPVVIKTDHKPLLGLLSPTKPLPTVVSPRVVRWRVTLLAYQYRLEYSPAAKQGNSDALSRLPLGGQEEPVVQPGDVLHMIETVDHMGAKAAQIREWSAKDSVMATVIRYVQFGWPDKVSDTLSAYYSRREELSLQEGCLLWGSRVVVPPKGRPLLLKVLHSGHPGVCSMKRLARGYLWWPGLDSEIEKLVASCESCQQHRPRERDVPMSPWSFPSRPWERVHIDYAGPFEGRMLLVIVDAFSKWIDVHITTSTSAAVTIDRLRQTFATHGLPAVIVSDNATSFTGEEFTMFVNRNGIRHMLSPPRHPASNGQAEAAVKVVKAALSKDEAGPLSTRLARFLLAYRVRPHSTTGRAPCELLMGRVLSTQLDLLRPDLRQQVQAKQEGWKENRDPKTRAPPDLTVGERAYVREVGQDGTGTGRWCKATVVEVGESSCKVRLSDGRVFHRHWDHVRRDEGTADVTAPREVRSEESERVEDPCEAPPEEATAAAPESAAGETVPSDGPAGPELSSPTRRSSRPRAPVERLDL